MMSFPGANPLAALGVPLASSVSFAVTPAVVALGVALGVLFLAACVVAISMRLGSRVVAWPMRTRQVAMPAMGTGGAHQ